MRFHNSLWVWDEFAKSQSTFFVSPPNKPLCLEIFVALCASNTPHFWPESAFTWRGKWPSVILSTHTSTEFHNSIKIKRTYDHNLMLNNKHCVSQRNIPFKTLPGHSCSLLKMHHDIQCCFAGATCSSKSIMRFSSFDLSVSHFNLL